MALARAAGAAAAAPERLLLAAWAPRTAPAPAAGSVPAAPNPNTWESRNLAMLDNPALKKGLKLVWFSTGKDDFLMPTTKATVDLLKKHGFTVAFDESPGGHTWINWRNYLNTFAPQLFQ